MDTKILLGELKAFREQMTAEVHEIRRDVRSLMNFKWKIIGVSAAASFMVTIILELARH